MENVTPTFEPLKITSHYLFYLTDPVNHRPILGLSAEGEFYVFGEKTEDPVQIKDALLYWHGQWKATNPTS